MEQIRNATAKRDTFTHAVEKEMAKFERVETDFRKKDWLERAAKLGVHADGYKLTQ